MAKNKTESKAQAAILKMLRDRQQAGEPIMHVKIAGNQYMEAGHPDILICYMGQMLFLEVKDKGKIAEPIQAHRMDQWRKAGAVSMVVYSADDVESLLSRVCI